MVKLSSSMLITFHVLSSPVLPGVNTPDTNTLSSGNPSLFLSVSLLSPIPSPSVSFHSVGSNGKASFESGMPSLSESQSALSPIPSPSVSLHSLGSSGKASSVSGHPSLSSSGSVQSGNWSLSKSLGRLIKSSGSLSQAISSSSK